ncbi:dihydrofolate reductase family protein [Streptomonospora nanhaiensis]|uniref:Dihydrofolate reductase n=1 Tax=Streptomonospora nanhaiensis TaxID=1323731 RepID=A0A853BNN7_9ACTN|nr:dihydrofolate reductase family protein [Streptomonospora nanhaiensis]MBX9388632.1 dihydrofolate reductase family protein [Streptomonospora nanhaiensis]NYI96257.1 dihydrofolate reductase [Streptomonospora nanhaiensis]
MASLIYSMIASLDGYVADARGDFSWAEPDPEVHAFINELERPIGTYLYGRRMYEMMTVWETDPALAEHSPELRDFAELWREADKVVYSTTLAATATRRTRIEPVFDPEAVRRLKENASRDVTVAGPTLAAHAFRAGLVDECHLFVVPVIVGGGLKAFPDDVRLDLTLQSERRFTGGTVFLHYTARPV